jgi:hypothetical protein
VIEQVPAVGLKRVAIAGDEGSESFAHAIGVHIDHVVKPDDQRRIADDLTLPVDDGGQLPHRPQAIAGVCLRQRTFGRLKRRLALLQLSSGERGLVFGHGFFDVEARIPDGEDRLGGEVLHSCAVALHCSQRGSAGLLLGEFVVPSGYDEVAASRLTSHSNGPGSVSSKSLMSNTNRRSGDAYAPKLDKCASPHSWVCRPGVGVVSRSAARHCGQPTGQLPTSCCSLVPVAMNSGQDAHQDLPDDAAEDVTDDSDSEGGQAEDDDSDSGLLQRSQEAIDEARDAARDALKETLPDDEDT